MTEAVLGKLRKHAERLTDEATRLQRELKRSQPIAAVVNLHVANVHDALRSLWLDWRHGIDKTDTEYAVEPQAETRGRKKEQRRRVQA